MKMALIGPFENAKELSKADETAMTMETSHYSHSAKTKQSDELARTLNQKAAESCTRNALLCINPLKLQAKRPAFLSNPLPPFCPSSCFLKHILYL